MNVCQVTREQLDCSQKNFAKSRSQKNAVIGSELKNLEKLPPIASFPWNFPNIFRKASSQKSSGQVACFFEIWSK